MFTRHEWKYIFLIITIFIAACIETDIFLPALSDIMVFFSVSEEAVQSLLTWNFIGICISGPFYGPISDAIGRKKPLLFALGLFFLGSIFTLTATSFYWMLLGRLLQGLGSGGCFTLGTAIIFDVFQQQKAIIALNQMNMICPFIMAAAPVLGGYLNYTFGFQSNFIAIAFFVFCCLTTSLLYFYETLAPEKRLPFCIKKTVLDFKRVAFSLPFWQTLLVISLLFSGYIVFLAGIALLFVLELGISKEALPLYQAALLATWLVASLTSAKAIHRFGIPTIKAVGTRLLIVSALALPLAAWTAPESPYLVTLAMMINAFGVNWIQGLYFPEGMELFPDIRGIAASFLTSARLLLTAVIVALSSHLYNGTIYPIAILIAALSFLSLILIYFYERRRTPVLVSS